MVPTALNFFQLSATAPCANRSFFHLDFQVESQQFKLNAPAIVDTGSSSTVIPKSFLDQRAIKSLYTRKGGSVQGVGGDARIIGYFTGTVRLGKFVLNDIECMVLDADGGSVPLLLGQNIFNHPTVDFFCGLP